MVWLKAVRFLRVISWCVGMDVHRPTEVLYDDAPLESLDVSYSDGLQPIVNVNVGGQLLSLVFDASSGNTIVFVKEKNACIPAELPTCYSYEVARRNGHVQICKANNDQEAACGATQEPYPCDEFLPSLSDVKKSETDQLAIDGIRYQYEGIEALDSMEVDLGQERRLGWSSMPVRLLIKPMSEHQDSPAQKPGPIPLFRGTNGILGASGPSLGCRNQTLWAAVLRASSASKFALDLMPPPQANVQDARGKSRVVLNKIDPKYKDAIIWSQPKQTGDDMNDGMHEFLIYRPHVCGVDLLYNKSSNWLAVLDTSGPCLSMPPFLFDAIMTHLPVKCPFVVGQPSQGRLCSPDRSRLVGNVTLPTLYFQLEDDQQPAPPRVHLPLERMVFTQTSSAGQSQELLCLARADSDFRSQTADMMYSHIAFGSLVVAAMYTVVDLEAATVGFAAKGDVATESIESFCAERVTCVSSMQTYFPPMNVCEDPDCSQYSFMTLDQDTRMCRWSSVVPVAFVALLLTLAILDLASHRLYKQAIEKASDYCQ